MVIVLTKRGRYSLLKQGNESSPKCFTYCSALLFIIPSLDDDDDDDDASNQRMRHRLIGTHDASPSPDFPISSGLEWLGKEHRSHSFTSGFTAVFFFLTQ